MSNLSEILFIVGDGVRLDSLPSARLRAPFADESLEFAQTVSSDLLSDPDARRYPELVALGFWLRKASLSRMADRWRSGVADGVLHLPRGTVFHIAPANVDTIFVYSWFLSLLAGNRNIMRLSTRSSPQVIALERVVTTGLSDPRHASVAQGTVICRYDRSDVVTRRLSALCDTRIIWGGDASVTAIRAIPLKPSANEVAFPNRQGLAVMGARSFVEADPVTRGEVARLFALDSYLFGQAACSSPRALCWVGSDHAAEATAIFWPLLRAAIAKIDHGIDPAMLVTKRIAADRLAIAGEVRSVSDDDPLMVRLSGPVDVAINHLRKGDDIAGGFFLETVVDEVDELISGLTSRTQTLVHWGLDRSTLVSSLVALIPEGPLRVVPLGSALNFSHHWDGYDLFDVLLRKVPIT
jgi:hypothetical protein